MPEPRCHVLPCDTLFTKCAAMVLCGRQLNPTGMFAHALSGMGDRIGKKGKNQGFVWKQFNGTENQGKIIIIVKEYTKQIIHNAIVDHPADPQAVGHQPLQQFHRKFYCSVWCHMAGIPFWLVWISCIPPSKSCISSFLLKEKHKKLKTKTWS